MSKSNKSSKEEEDSKKAVETKLRTFLDTKFLNPVTSIIDSPLEMCILQGQTEVLLSLLKLGKFDPNKPLKWHGRVSMTPLQFSCFRGLQKTTIMLVNNGGCIETPLYRKNEKSDSRLGANCLLLCFLALFRIHQNKKLVEKYIGVIEYLLFHAHAKTDCIFDNGLTCLLIAIKLGNLDLIEWVLLKGGDANGFKVSIAKIGVDEYMGVVKRQTEIYKGGDVYFLNTPLYYAIENHWFNKKVCFRIFKLLMKYGADVNFGYQYDVIRKHELFKRKCALYLSIILCSTDILEFLIDNNLQFKHYYIDENDQSKVLDRTHDTPLFLSYITGHLDAIKLIRNSKKYKVQKSDKAKARSNNSYANVVSYVDKDSNITLSNNTLKNINENYKRSLLLNEKREAVIKEGLKKAVQKISENDEKLLALNIAPHCDICGVICLKACSGCKSVYYCSRKHQIQAWKEHKKKCKKLLEIKNKAEANNKKIEAKNKNKTDSNKKK